MAAKNKANEIYITRIYEAPLKAVWEAWTDPDKAALWWGPRGHSIKTHSKDLRAGGHWHYTMYGPAGEVWPNKTVYFEVEPLRKLVYDHGGNDDQPPLFRVTVTFEEVKGGKTKMDMTMTMPTAEIATATKKFIKQASGNSTWDRLAEFVARESKGDEIFVINRSFPASQEVVFDMFTKPEHLAKWLPPTGVTMEFIRADIRPGGETFFVMSGEGGLKMYGRAHYLNIERAHTVDYTQGFATEKGEPARHFAMPTFPLQMLTQVRLEAEETGETRVKIQWQPQGEVTPEELKTFIDMRASMTQGWTGSFDKLEEILSRR